MTCTPEQCLIRSNAFNYRVKYIKIMLSHILKLMMSKTTTKKYREYPNKYLNLLNSKDNIAVNMYTFT